MVLTKDSLSARLAGIFGRQFTIVLLSVVTGLLVIFLYSLIELFFFSSNGRNLIEILFLDVSAREIFVRTIITLAFLAFGLFAARVVAKVRRTQQALSFSESRFETIANYTPSWENWVDAEGNLLWVNPAVEKITGYAVKEVLSMKNFPLPLVFEEDRDRASRNFNEAVEGSSGRELEFRVVRKDGSVFWAAVTWQPLFDENGRSLGHRSSIRDISKRKAAVQALKHAVEGTAAAFGRDFFKSLTRHLGQALDVRLVVIGEVVSETSGYWTMAIWEREPEGKQASLDLDAATYQLLAQRTAAREALDLDQVLSKEHVLCRRGFKSCLGVPLPGADQVPLGILLVLDDRKLDEDRTALAGSLMDIFAARAGSELKRQRAEDELRRREEKYRILFERSADAMLIIDDNRFVDCNHATLEMLGFESKQLLFETHPSVLSPAFQPDGRASFEKAEEMMEIARTRGSNRFEWLHRKADGTVFPVEVLLTSVPAGKRQQIHVVWRDITNRKRAEQTLRSMVEVTSATVGEDFFRSMVGNLAVALGPKCVVVGELTPAGDSIQTLYVWANGAFVPNYEYSLVGTPCENMIGQEPCLFPSGVREMFPGNSKLEELAAESYLGTPLFGSDGKPLGLIAVIDDKPMDEIVAGIGRSLTDILAARASAEIERVRAQAALVESEEKFRLISEQSMLGILVLQNDVLRYCNQAVADMFEYTIEEMMGWGPGEVYRIVDAEDRSFVADQSHRKQAGEAGKNVVTNYTWRGVTKSGRRKWFELYSRTVDFEGRISDLVTVVDITEKKLAEEAEQKSQQMVQTVLNTIPVRVFWKNRDLEYVGCNRLLAQDAGLQSPDEITGKTDFDLSWKSMAEAYRADDRKVIDAGMLKLGYEESQPTEDGRTVWVRTNKVPLRDQNNNIIGVLGSYEDITERRKAARDLQNSEATLKSVLKAAPVGIGLFNDKDGLKWSNDRLSELTGYTREELVKLPPEQIFLTIEEFRRMQEVGTGNLSTLGFGILETRWRRKDGQAVDVIVNLTRVDPERRESDLVFTVMDITARKATENALRQTTTELKSERAALNDKNAALKEVLEHLEREKAVFKQRVWDDIEKELLPFLDSMKQFSPPELQTQIDVVADDLKTLMSQDVDEFQIRYARLTPREREICDLIKDGKSSKEISDLLNVSLPTVHKHRERIRRKLKIMNKDVNLNTYLHFR